jgi:hypothetical protein
MMPGPRDRQFRQQLTMQVPLCSAQGLEAVIGPQKNREPSLSNDEYDPERPLKDMLDHVGIGMDKLGIFDIEPIRPQYPVRLLFL